MTNKDIYQINQKIRQLNADIKHRNSVFKAQRAERIVNAESYVFQIFFYPHIEKKLGMAADTVETFDLQLINDLFNYRLSNNAGIYRMRVYYNGKPFRAINFKGNEIESINCTYINLV